MTKSLLSEADQFHPDCTTVARRCTRPAGMAIMRAVFVLGLLGAPLTGFAQSCSSQTSLAACNAIKPSWAQGYSCGWMLPSGPCIDPVGFTAPVPDNNGCPANWSNNPGSCVADAAQVQVDEISPGQSSASQMAGQMTDSPNLGGLSIGGTTPYTLNGVNVSVFAQGNEGGGLASPSFAPNFPGDARRLTGPLTGDYAPAAAQPHYNIGDYTVTAPGAASACNSAQAFADASQGIANALPINNCSQIVRLVNATVSGASLAQVWIINNDATAAEINAVPAAQGPVIGNFQDTGNAEAFPVAATLLFSLTEVPITLTFDDDLTNSTCGESVCDALAASRASSGGGGQLVPALPAWAGLVFATMLIVIALRLGPGSRPRPAG